MKHVRGMFKQVGISVESEWIDGWINGLDGLSSCMNRCKHCTGHTVTVALPMAEYGIAEQGYTTCMLYSTTFMCFHILSCTVL